MIPFPVFPNMAMAKAMGYEVRPDQPLIIWRRKDAGWEMAVVLPVKDADADR